MPKLIRADIQRIQTANQGTVNLRAGIHRVNITVHMGRCGVAAGVREIIKTLLGEMNENRISDVVMTSSDCVGNCAGEPMMTVHVQGTSPVRYGNLSPEKARRIFHEHVLTGHMVPEYVLPADGAKI